MNMEEWQRRMRAEKEAERKKKTESAELLRGYRGGVNDEELKRRTLREEERRKTMDAQQNLHNYKGLAAIERLQQQQNAKKHQQAATHPVPVNAGSSSSNKDRLAGLEFTSVSDRAAALAAAAEAAGQIPSPTGYQPAGVRASLDGTRDGEEEGTGDVNDGLSPAADVPCDSNETSQQLETSDSDKGGEAVSADCGGDDEQNEVSVKEEEKGVAPSLNPATSFEDEKKETLPSETFLENQATKAIPNDASVGQETGEADNVEVVPTTTPDAGPALIVDTTNEVAAPLVSRSLDVPLSASVEPLTTPKDDIAVVSESQPAGESESVTVAPIARNSNANATSDEPLPPPKTPESGPKRVNVMFSFGVVSTQDNPDLFAYMNAVEKVVLRCLQADSGTDGINFNPKFRPFVKKTEKDGKVWRRPTRVSPHPKGSHFSFVDLFD